MAKDRCSNVEVEEVVDFVEFSSHVSGGVMLPIQRVTATEADEIS